MKEYFYLPGYYIFYNELKILFKYKKNNINKFISNRIIAGSYDLPYGLKWNGGRVVHADLLFDKRKTREIIDYYQNKDEFILLHTCTNLFINDNKLNDTNCNYFIKEYYRKKDKIIIANTKLKEYLSQTYKNISFVNSTTLGIIDLNIINEITKNEVYVLHYSKNNDNDYLHKLTQPENIEILCAEPCYPNCPNRANHYAAISKALNGQPNDLNKYSPCPFAVLSGGSISYLIENIPHMINNQRIEELSNMGFHHFKISGRTLTPPMWFEVIIYYLVKLEYRKEVYNDLIKIWLESNI